MTRPKKPAKKRATRSSSGTKRPRGRPTELTPKLAARAVKAFGSGVYLHDIAAICGVHRDTLDGWFRRGRAEDGTVYADFSDKMLAARAELRERLLKSIAKEKSWRAKTWILSSRWPDDFATRERRYSQPDAVLDGESAATIEPELVADALAGDQDALAQVISRSISGATVRVLDAVGSVSPGVLPQVLVALQKVQTEQGGAKLRYSTILPNFGGPAESKPPEPSGPAKPEAA